MVLGLLGVSAGGWAASWTVGWGARRLGQTQGLDGVASLGTGALTSAITGVAVCLLLWRLSGRLAGVPGVVVSAAGVLLAGSATVALHGTRWGFAGLYSDTGFRTEVVTRFTDSAALSDYAYRGLPAYYPPLIPWLEGRVASVLGLPGWAVMKPAQLVVCLVIPLLAWLFWRRVVPSLPAAWIAAIVPACTVLPVKADEWLVLTLIVPWWLEVVRGVKNPDARARAWWGHGLVLGLLLLCHTYFFAPLALATAAGLALDLVRGRGWALRPLQALRIGAVGSLVSAPSWGPMVWLRLTGAAADNLQLRWSWPGFDVPFHAFPWGSGGVVEIMGVVGLLVAARTSELARSLLLAFVGGLVFMVGGQLLQPLGVAILPEKSQELLDGVLLAAGVLGACRVGSMLMPWLRGRQAARVTYAPLRRSWFGALPRVTLHVVVVLLLVTVAEGWNRANFERPASAALHMRYPNGTFPAGGPLDSASHWHPWGVPPTGAGASVQEVTQAWQRLTGQPMSSRTVLVSARADVVATVPVHAFVTWKSIYSHPNGRFAGRVSLLRQVADCRTPRCAWTLLRTNPYDSVDGLLLSQRGSQSFLTVTVDNFPDGWTPNTIVFDRELFARPFFRQAALDGTDVIQVLPE